MDRVLFPSKYKGCVTIPASKSEFHRILFIADMCSDKVNINYNGTLCEDVVATKMALSGLKNSDKTIDVGESGTTLRFVVSRVGLYGKDVGIKMHGRLPQRPMRVFLDELEKHNMRFSQDNDVLFCSGKLTCGEYELPGGVSSQYISSLLLTLPFLDGNSVIKVKGKIESEPYVNMTISLLNKFGIDVIRNACIENGITKSVEFKISGNQRVVCEKSVNVGGDFSSATFFATLAALSEDEIYIRGLDTRNSTQGDRVVFDILKDFGARVEVQNDGYIVRKNELNPLVVDASNIPDMVMALSVILSCAKGRSVIKNCARLRLKESNRIESTLNMLRVFGIDANCENDNIIINANGYDGLREAVVDTYNDHRIAMSASVFSSVSKHKITIKDADCVNKSYPGFFDDLKSLAVLK